MGANNKWLSVVDATLNSNNPCVSGTVAAAAADSTHSAALQAGEFTKIVNVPQSTLLLDTKTYAVCYAETDGTDDDATWADSYVRLKASKMLTIGSHSTS